VPQEQKNGLMKRTYFPPEVEAKVRTSISEECDAGNCSSCPDIFERKDYPGERVFCIHECHLKKNNE
jgi:hypothetical protein